MQKKIVKTGAAILLCIFVSGLQAQEAITVSGGNAGGQGGSASYTIGQMVYTTNKGNNGTVTQGVQRSYEIVTVDEPNSIPGITLDCSTYPNPTTDYVNLQIENYENYETGNLMYQLFNMGSELIESKKILSRPTIIPMQNLLPGIYFLKVTDGKTGFKTFKIIKN